MTRIHRRLMCSQSNSFSRRNNFSMLHGFYSSVLFNYASHSYSWTLSMDVSVFFASD